MTQNGKLIVAGMIGILIFCTGAGLRLQAERLATFEMKYDLQGQPLKDYTDTPGHKPYQMIDGARKKAITDISLVLIWAGGALVVISLAAWLFPRNQETAY